ncbi:hypothetical protein CJF31_00003788 [Rutstroemia sp. NJR-2017a BVV2]|nr:hypothetical protein CJF31_00003788 [Rutstroemia sp. NJR-2017a BVV2]
MSCPSSKPPSETDGMLEMENGREQLTLRTSHDDVSQALWCATTQASKAPDSDFLTSRLKRTAESRETTIAQPSATKVVRGFNVTAPPTESIAVNEYSVSTSQPTDSPDTMYTKHELQMRDIDSVQYSKQLLEEGDTLVYVSYPADISFYDSNGLNQPYKIYRVNSERMKNTGSSRFTRMFEDWPQHIARKRKGLLKCPLPEGIKYVLDLTPLEEGDEAVELVSELSCSPGIRNWYDSMTRCGVPPKLVAGDDDVPRHAIVPPKVAAQFNLKITQSDRSRPTTASWVSQENIDPFPEPYSANTLAENETSWDAPNALQEALRRSVADALSAHSSPSITEEAHATSNVIKKEVADYCPIRHRMGIENLLLIIQGKEPILDSAPKLWTLFVLAKYYDCTSAIVDHVTSWLLVENNIKFLEILPEASLNIGLGLKMPMITRASFAVLVSEGAFRLACQSSDKPESGSRLVRAQEELDEDLLNIVQHASQDFYDRIQETTTDLLDERMAWFLDLPEYRKICKFEDYNYKLKERNKEDQFLYERRKASIQKLLANLRGYVRGRIVFCMSQRIHETQNRIANDRRRQLQWRGPKRGDEHNFQEVYGQLTGRERVMLPYFWHALQAMCWQEDWSAHLFGSSFSSSWDRHTLDINGFPAVTLSKLDESRNLFNNEVYLTMKNLHPLFPPMEPTIDSANVKLTSQVLKEEKPNYAFMSAYNPDHAYHQARLAGSKALELEDDASISSVATDASTRPLFNIPIRSAPKKDPIPEGKPESHRDADKNLGASNMSPSSGRSGTQYITSILKSFPHKHITTEKPRFDAAAERAQESPVMIFGERPLNYFDLTQFLHEVGQHVNSICEGMLTKADDAELTSLTDTLLCLDDNEFKYLPLWAGGNDDGSGGVTSSAVPPAYYSNVDGLTPGIQYKGKGGFVGVGSSSINTSLNVRHGSQDNTTTMSDTSSFFSTDSYDMMTPTGSQSESDFEMVSDMGDFGDDGTEIGDDDDSMSFGEDNLGNEDGDGEELDWIDEEEADWDEDSFTDN